MASQVDEEALENFRVNEEGLRDLDSIVRRHCETVKYYVYKGSELGGYDTENVEVLLRERNGPESRLQSVKLHATGAQTLTFHVDFDETVVISGECEDRARLVLLTTEAKAVIKDRMKGRTLQQSTILTIIGLIFLVVGYIGFEQFQNSYVNQHNAEQLSRTNRVDAPYARELKAVTPSNQKLLAEAISALSQHNLNAEVGVLLQQQVGELRQGLVSTEEEQAFNAITYSASPWWSNSYWLVLAVAIATAAIAVGIGYLTVPSSQSVFLIGDENRRQERAAKRRERIIWGVGATFILGVLSGLVSSLH
jgi:hypothetical protein